MASKIDADVRYGFAEFSPDTVYRYRLTRQFTVQPPYERKSVTFVMLNPSTADADVGDPTVRRCMQFAKMWHCDQLNVVNLFAYRATSPKALPYVDDPIGPNNDKVILKACQPHGSYQQPLVICAWGNDGLLRNRAWEVTTMLWDAGIPIYYLRKNMHSDQPTHPLYLPKVTEPVLWPEARIYSPGFKGGSSS